MKTLSKIKGIIWFINRYGLIRYINYEKCRREGIKIDYSKVFSSKDLETLKSYKLI